MKRLLVFVFVLPLPVLTAAEVRARPNALTKAEIAEGWIALFDGETTFGWRSPNGSKWSVVDGMLYPEAGKPGLLVTTTAFKDYELRFEYQARVNSVVQVLVASDREGRTVGENTVKVATFGSGWYEGRLTVKGGQPLDARFSQVGQGIFPPPPAFKFLEPRVGHIALSGNGVIFRKIKLRPLGAKALFNGKDLTGWKLFEGKGKKSKFTVTKEGWLKVKDGPGDLQTTALYDDFVLQLECISNGKHLNSGLFFRAIPGQYQQGYEAQIRNQFLDKGTNKYTVEDYDPKTHELIGKRTVFSPAVDYGTGAIYRRMPARIGVAKDGEWFTLTVVAEGRHFATWVNGVQVVDWDDHRPTSDNARKGYRAEKGALSIQGHDPTTDLSFRNIRIGELKAMKGPEKR